MIRMFVGAAAAALALAPIAAQAKTLSFHFDTQDAFVAQGGATAVAGLSNSGTWSYDAAPISISSYGDNSGLIFGADVDDEAIDGAIDEAFDRIGSIHDLSSNGGLGADNGGEVRSAGAPAPSTWLMLAVGLALLVGRHPSRQDRQRAFAWASREGR